MKKLCLVLIASLVILPVAGCTKKAPIVSPTVVQHVLDNVNKAVAEAQKVSAAVSSTVSAAYAGGLITTPVYNDIAKALADVNAVIAKVQADVAANPAALKAQIVKEAQVALMALATKLATLGPQYAALAAWLQTASALFTVIL